MEKAMPLFNSLPFDGSDFDKLGAHIMDSKSYGSLFGEFLFAFIHLLLDDFNFNRQTQ